MKSADAIGTPESGQLQPSNRPDPVEAPIEGRDRLYTAVHHDRRVDGVPHRNPGRRDEDALGKIRVGERHVEDLGDQRNEKIVDLFGEIESFERRVPIEDLLEHLGAGAELEIPIHRPLQKS